MAHRWSVSIQRGGKIAKNGADFVDKTAHCYIYSTNDVSFVHMIVIVYFDPRRRQKAVIPAKNAASSTATVNQTHCLPRPYFG